MQIDKKQHGWFPSKDTAEFRHHVIELSPIDINAAMSIKEKNIRINKQLSSFTTITLFRMNLLQCFCSGSIMTISNDNINSYLLFRKIAVQEESEAH